ncbi:MAG: NERD domain-containing protein, partial [Solirubrobacteraceae bacterium]
MKDAWTQVTPSEFPWEREGLAFLKERLPDHDPFRAWANFEFIVDGTVSEVDVLVVAKKGIFLVELKGWQGRVSGDAGTWERTRPNAVHPRLEDNPFILANKKAKRLKSLLSRQKALRGKRLPFIAALIFLSDPDLRIQLTEEAQRGVTQRDDKETDDLPGVVGALTTLTAEEQRRGRPQVDRPMAKLITAAIEQAGIRPSQR